MSISNYVQFLEMELKNAGLNDPAYHQKRIEFCRELLQWCGSDEQLVSSSRIAIADAHFDDGDEAECDKLFEGWLRDDPNWDVGYIAWADCYQFKRGDQDIEKAEEILLAGYAESGLLNKIDVLAQLIALYEDTGRPEKAVEFENIFSELLAKQPQSNAEKEFIKALSERQQAPRYVSHEKTAPVRVVKIGRNEPCPCGSGRKYKRCCGA